MNFRLKTSAMAEEKLLSLQASTGFTWNILSRLAVSLSLNDPSNPPLVEDKGGVEIHRNVMTGENDYIFKALIRQHANENITDEDYFPNVFNAHLERGINLLYNEYQYAGNYEKFLLKLLTLEV
ncbi:DNA sulfur modification protein DndE [Planomicrobium okeanokoites]|uniref:DNA sulfur modification protein DndE n=1 Tax=Planomicrobium okeanokoites TaxID=244 RepID=UPI000A02C916|nr:DNA sulfur modification protein DndE [Planomicrobium okeanokoites]